MAPRHLPAAKIVLLFREPNPAIGKGKTMDSPSDAEVIGRSLGEPEAFGLIYDRHAATLLRFLGRRAGAKVAEGLVGEVFRIARSTPGARRSKRRARPHSRGCTGSARTCC